MRQLKSVSNTRNICGSTVNRGRPADIPDHVSARTPHGHVRLQQAGQPQVYSAKRPVPQGSPRQEEARPMNILLEVFWLIKMYFINKYDSCCAVFWSLVSGLYGV